GTGTGDEDLACAITQQFGRGEERGIELLSEGINRGRLCVETLSGDLQDRAVVCHRAILLWIREVSGLLSSRALCSPWQSGRTPPDHSSERLRYADERTKDSPTMQATVIK